MQSWTQSDALCAKEVFAYTVSVLNQDWNRSDFCEILSETDHLSEIIIIITFLLLLLIQKCFTAATLVSAKQLSLKCIFVNIVFNLF